MTDQELLELLQRKLPEELSVAEIELLATRMRDSAKWRTILAERIELEACVAGVLGRIELSAESLVSRAEAHSLRGYGVRPVLGLTACAVLLGVAVYNVGPWVFGGGGQESSPVTAHKIPVDEADRANGNNSPESVWPGARPAPPDPPIPSVRNVQQPPVSSAERAAAPLPPWDRETQLGAPPRSWEELAEDGFPRGVEPPSPADASRWFGPRPWQAVDCQFQGHVFRLLALEGALPVHAPWREDAVLRIALAVPQNLKFTFFRADQGLALEYYASPQPGWAAYAVARPKAN